MRSTPGWGDPKAPLPPEARVATPTATFEFPFVWITWRVPDSDWLISGSEDGTGQVTEIGTSMPSDARVAGEPAETARPESADAAAGSSASDRTEVRAPNRRSRSNIICHLIEALAGTAQTLRGKPSQSQSRRGFKIGIKERDLTDWSPRRDYAPARSRRPRRAVLGLAEIGRALRRRPRARATNRDHCRRHLHNPGGWT